MDDVFPEEHSYGPLGIVYRLLEGVSLDYWYAYYGTLSMIYEGKYQEVENLEDHLLWWKNIINQF